MNKIVPLILGVIVVVSISGCQKQVLPSVYQDDSEKEETSVVVDDVKEEAPEEEIKDYSFLEPTLDYVELFSFSGTGNKKSEPFTIEGTRFKIAYECTGSYCGAYLYDLSNGMPQVVMNAAESLKDETIMYGSGEYYLESNTIGPFTMTVYDYKPTYTDEQIEIICEKQYEEAVEQDRKNACAEMNKEPGCDLPDSVEQVYLDYKEKNLAACDKKWRESMLDLL